MRIKPEDVSASVIETISRALHDTFDEVMIDGVSHKIGVGSNGCRYLIYGGVMFMEQNKRKASPFAALARRGYQIVWGMFPSSWMYIRDHVRRNPREDRLLSEKFKQETQEAEKLIAKWL